MPTRETHLLNLTSTGSRSLFGDFGRPEPGTAATARRWLRNERLEYATRQGTRIERGVDYAIVLMIALSVICVPGGEDAYAVLCLGCGLPTKRLWRERRELDRPRAEPKPERVTAANTDENSTHRQPHPTTQSTTLHHGKQSPTRWLSSRAWSELERARCSGRGTTPAQIEQEHSRSSTSHNSLKHIKLTRTRL